VSANVPASLDPCMVVYLSGVSVGLRRVCCGFGHFVVRWYEISVASMC
jgi:hypothetical protein